MTPQTFIARWQGNELSERAGAQAHFDDLCDLLGVEKPRDAENYCFERGAEKAGGGNGWADVWKRGCFGWENKKPGRDLKAALKQLTDYALHLENPPLLIVCDRERIEIHTAFTGYPDEPKTLRIDELIDEDKRQLLKWVFTDPEKLKPEKSTAAITEEVAGQFAALAEVMRKRALDAKQVAHFLVQCLFCMFAEDENLLPEKLFSVLLEKYGKDVRKAADNIARLFAAMQTGETFGLNEIPWFNGGLFRTINVPALEVSDLDKLRAAAQMDWRAIDPTIFGTFFERGLNPKSRAKLGAHYTDPGTINKLIPPLVFEPLVREWKAVRAKIEKAMPKAGKKIPKKALDHYQAFLHRLENFRVLDPACGSGNFLYLALRALREVEKRARIEAAEMGLQAGLSMHTGPHNILGLEINEFAAELARVTVWIGDIQWSRQNNYPPAMNPVLKPLEGIEHRDALILTRYPLSSEPHPHPGPPLEGEGAISPPLQGAGAAYTPLPLQGEGPGMGMGCDPRTTTAEADWPKTDVIVGNPPFTGGSKMRGELGDAYVETLRKVYKGRVPGGADLVCYWFYKANKHRLESKARAVGLVATNSIRGGANRRVLDAIVADTRIFEAWSDEPWVNDGAAVRVSLIAFGDQGTEDGGQKTVKITGGEAAANQSSLPRPLSRIPPLSPALSHKGSGCEKGRGEFGMCRLDGREVAAIHADLTAGEGLDLTKAQTLAENKLYSFMGASKKASFDIPGSIAREWLKLPNPNGKFNNLVVRPWANGMDITRRSSDTWIIDFGTSMTEADASMFEKPFEYVLENVKPEREKNNRESYRKFWWRHAEARPAMRGALLGLPRYIATPHVSKHRLFVFQDVSVLPDQMLIVIARSDDCTFGILHSRFHELWSLRLGTSLEDRPRYTPTTCLETFPFPEGCTPRDTAPSPLVTPSPLVGEGRGEGWDSGEGKNASAAMNALQTECPLPALPLSPAREERADQRRVAPIANAIAAAAIHLNQLRENWLNPPEWVDWVITPEEEKAGFPQRPVAKSGHEADLKKRTLTNLYNAHPAWLDTAHKTLDEAVAAAYGWADYTPETPDEEILRRLLALNQERRDAF
ncbi:MAG: class I SAM-dependent DNA methyltransferase [Zoogloeaceae bacterium]|jgi:type II restriction/modification system DNA methylase subunit YeeA|nr:class I SAM-dependent DNA methyltransferase [Zoogloeaceae bacterium]